MSETNSQLSRLRTLQQSLSDLVSLFENNINVPMITIANTVTSQVIDPNKLYMFTNRTSNLTLSLGTEVEGKANEYHLFLSIPANTSPVPTITWPTGIQWQNGLDPTIKAGYTYEVSILNNIAAVIEA